MGIAEHWSVRQLRDKQDEMAYERSLIAVKPEDEIVKTLEKVTPTHRWSYISNICRNTICNQMRIHLSVFCYAAKVIQNILS
jgi:hypothetical protein